MEKFILVNIIRELLAWMILSYQLNEQRERRNSVDLSNTIFV